ncbi:Lipoprotein-releasing system ATP-binding protein LolD [Nostocoides japonicum T1-X7]|uniref:Lipoprotein-releasing system ATP-binding protein LolD n=1 Tax=Nostocoides japonicum T1-X7 TaxID=1194083 RepID=A0A077LWH2_9MICO|nr:ABC transporter ATP-binding protein [Tetrasphaera japonica]CCH77147.1 Lipoprotein-releasing system ATP-binding protein LolD [Tetrasphaera japonica T1-X7]
MRPDAGITALEGREEHRGGSGLALRLDDVHVRFGDTQALRGLSVEVGPGEVVAVTGPSGSGKSTLLLCLAGLLVPDTGRVTVGYTVVSSLPDDARTRMRRSEIGVLFQFGELVPELTAVENVLLPLLFSGIRRPVAHDRAMAWLRRLRLDDRADEQVSGLSGGEAQRVALARALVIEPTVLLADEPTGALDTPTGQLVMREMVDTVRASGTTAVIVTHESRVAAYADREIHLRDGAVLGEPAVGRSGLPGSAARS